MEAAMRTTIALPARHEPRRRHWIALLRLWRQRSEQRRELAALSDRTLRDIGITRLDAVREAQKPFWRD
jgi:uncharacterized protein YjiS (DUF1127 family)